MKLSTGQNLFNALSELGFIATQDEMSQIIHAVEADNEDEVRSKEEIEKKQKAVQEKYEILHENYKEGADVLEGMCYNNGASTALQWVLKQND